MKTTLYLGTDPAHYPATGHLIHYPVIKVVPRPLTHPDLVSAFAEMSGYTHLIFTSKNAVRVFFAQWKEKGGTVEELKEKKIIAIGMVTAMTLLSCGLNAQWIAEEETQEGVVALLQELPLEGAYFFLPRSSLSRPVITAFFEEKKIPFFACDLYDTHFQALEPKPDLTLVDEIVFTSPSTVRGFLEAFGALPKGKKCLAIGPVTKQELIDRLA